MAGNTFHESTEHWTKTVSWKTQKSLVKLRGTAELRDNVLLGFFLIMNNTFHITHSDFKVEKGQKRFSNVSMRHQNKPTTGKTLWLVRSHHWPGKLSNRTVYLNLMCAFLQSGTVCILIWAVWRKQQGNTVEAPYTHTHTPCCLVLCIHKCTCALPPS